jgi:predicted nucleotidyltransferase
MHLLRTLNSVAADEAAESALRLLEESRLRPVSAYVAGSYANGYAVSTSDVDLYVIFDRSLSESEKQALEELSDRLERQEPQIDLVAYELEQLKSVGVVEMGRHFVHVWGRPVHDEIPNPPIDDYLYRSMHGAYSRMGMTRRTKPYRWPLSFPDEADEYKGYAWRTFTENGIEQASVKEIVVLSGRLSRSL